jgi:hypothetical protein
VEVVVVRVVCVCVCVCVCVRVFAYFASFVFGACCARPRPSRPARRRRRRGARDGALCRPSLLSPLHALPPCAPHHETTHTHVLSRATPPRPFTSHTRPHVPLQKRERERDDEKSSRDSQSPKKDERAPPVLLPFPPPLSPPGERGEKARARALLRQVRAVSLSPALRRARARERRRAPRRAPRRQKETFGPGPPTCPPVFWAL